MPTQFDHLLPPPGYKAVQGTQIVIGRFRKIPNLDQYREVYTTYLVSIDDDGFPQPNGPVYRLRESDREWIPLGPRSKDAIVAREHALRNRKETPHART